MIVRCAWCEFRMYTAEDAKAHEVCPKDPYREVATLRARLAEAERERDLALKGVPEAALIHKRRAESAESRARGAEELLRAFVECVDQHGERVGHGCDELRNEITAFLGASLRGRGEGAK